jgi:DNA polymerase-3 subunit delta
LPLTPEKLPTHLAGRLLPVYLVSGDEPLQSGECADAIRAAARDAGHTTREVLDAGAGFDWNRLAAEAASLSLFAEKKVLDLRLASATPGSEGSRALTAYCDDPPPDTLLLVTLPRLDRKQLGSKWVKAVESVGALIRVWPIDATRLPAWIAGRLRAAGLRPSEDAVRLLAERVEGNLLAARQEIEKLVLWHGKGELGVEQLRTVVADSARYDPFELVDTALRGDAARGLHILDGLRGEGVPPARILWALHREVHGLARMAADIARGTPPAGAMAANRVFDSRKAIVQQGLTRLRTPRWLALLDLCHATDRAIKGLSNDDPWRLLDAVVLGICGHPPLPDGHHETHTTR